MAKSNTGGVPLKMFLALTVVMTIGSVSLAMTPDDISTMASLGMEDLSSDGQFLLYSITATPGQDLPATHTVYRREIESGRDLIIFSPDDDGMWPTFSPDGQSIGYVRAGDSGLEFWVMDSDGGHRRSVAEVPQGIRSFQWAPDGSAVAWIESSPSYEYGGVDGEIYVADRVGYRHLKAGYRQGELAQVFSLNLADGIVSTVTHGAFDVRSFSWSPDSRQLVYSAKELHDLGVNLNTDLWVASLDGLPPFRITSNPGGDDKPQWLADGRIAWLRRENPIWESAPAVVAVASAETGDKGPYEIHGSGYDDFIYKFGYDNGKFLILGAHHGAMELVRVDGDQNTVLSKGQNDFWRLQTANGKAVLQGGGQMLPSAIFILDLDSESSLPEKPRILINPHEDWILRTGLTTPERFIVTVDGTDIEGWYYLPANMGIDERVPVVLSIHGGPEWMYGGYFLPEFHILPTFGYAVIIANPTGSTGYGTEFQKNIQGDWVDRPSRELLACLSWAQDQGWADPEHLAVMGGSYGGLLGAALTTRGNQFKAAALDRMVPDQVTFWGTTDEKWFPEWEFGGSPWDEEAREIYYRNSPMNFVGNVRTPTLVSQGLRDYRCLAAGGEMWFSALRAQGIPARLLRFADEGHGLRNGRNKVFYYHQLLEWFDKYVLNMMDEELLPEAHD